MELVRLLGEQYLWVDALCIVQDDEEGKREQLRTIGSIYANAYATIAVTSDVASCGLRGIEGVTSPITRRRHELGEKLVVRDLVEALKVDMDETLWNNRGWTFQEQIFSRRIIVFGKFEVSWEYHCGVWFDGHEPRNGLCSNRQPSVTRNFDVCPTPNLDDIFRHVAQYNRRELIYPEDVLEAFSGITTTLETWYPRGFCAGTPVCMLDNSLLWWKIVPLVRRQAKRQGAVASMPPTWSWAAWRGVVYDNNGTPWLSKPLFEWAYKASPETATTRLPWPQEKSYDCAEAAQADDSLGHSKFQHVSHLLYGRAPRCVLPVTGRHGTRIPIGLEGYLKRAILHSCEELDSDVTPTECEVVALSAWNACIYGVESTTVSSGLNGTKASHIEKVLDTFLKISGIEIQARANELTWCLGSS